MHLKMNWNIKLDTVKFQKNAFDNAVKRLVTERKFQIVIQDGRRNIIEENETQYKTRGYIYRSDSR